MADTLVRTLAEWGAFFGADGKPYDVIDLMGQDNSINDDCLYMEANGKDGHTTAIMNGLPTISFARLYKGTPVSKSARTQIKDACAMMEGRNEIDVRLLRLNAENAAAYRASEAKAFTEALMQQHATSIFYGDADADPDQFFGLNVRYPLTTSPNVVTAGGTGSTCTDIWGIVWGSNEVHGIFPKGSKAGLTMQSLPEYDAFDGDTNRYRAVGDLFQWNVGLTVRDWRCVVRICNIDVTKLGLAKGATGFVDLHRLTIQAKNKVPTSKRGRMIWYCNQDVLTALELQASDAGNVQLTYGELFDSKQVPYLHGRPVRQCDAILSTQTALT